MKKLMARVEFALALVCVAWLSGCMSMDEMLASEDGFWRDIGETRAVDFALDTANPLEKRLEVVPKIANQQKLAKIVIARNVAPEVKNEARKRIDEASALTTITLNAPDKNDQMDALRQITKSEDSRIEAAWIFAEHKPSSNALQTLLGGLSDAGRAKFAASFTAKIDAASAASKDAEELCRKYGDSMASGKLKEAENILKSLVVLAPYVEDENTIAAILKREDIADVKGTEYDFLSPLEDSYQKAVAARKAREAKEFLASLTDEERVKILEVGRLTKLGKTIVVSGATAAEEKKSAAGNGSDSRPVSRDADRGQASSASGADEYKVSRFEVLNGIKNQELSKSLAKKEEERMAREMKAWEERMAREEAERKKAEYLAAKKVEALSELDKAGVFEGLSKPDDLKGAAHDIALYKGPGRWLKAVAVFDSDPVLQQELVRLMFGYTGHDRSDGKDKQQANDKMLAKLPQTELGEMLLQCFSGKGNETHLAFAISRNIKDQAVLKKLLVDDDSWARNMKLTGHGPKRLEMAYDNLVANVTDAAIADHLFFVTRPTAKRDTISFQTIGSLTGRISADKRKALTEQALARSADVAKTNIVVKGYYPGMSYLDYMMINLANGNPSKRFKYDTAQSRKIVEVTFLREQRINFIGIVDSNPTAAIHKFESMYGKVNDGVDVSGKTETAFANRSSTSLSSDPYSVTGVDHESEGFWKFVDHAHGFQAEISCSDGALTLRGVVIENEFNHTDNTKAQQNAIVDLFAASDEEEDQGPDEGLEPVGK